MNKLRQLFTEYNPDYPFEYHFVRDDYAAKFRDSQKIATLVIASPIVWFIMNQWLAGFQYRIHIDAWTFLLAGSLSILIATLTVGGQAITAARSNTARSLRPS